jgi:outer membrane lipoprotein-sorting protein
MSNSISKNIIKLFAVALLLTSSVAAQKADNLKPADIISKHLDSIGTKEKRDEVKTRIIKGMSEFESKLPSRKTTGKAVVVSDAKNLMFVTSFASREYPFEKIGYFADGVSLPYISAGTRSPLGAFVNDHKTMLSEGLFTGTMSSTWNPTNPKFGRGKFDSAGTKKIDGRKTYALNYYSDVSSGTEYLVRLYFDTETFQHLRTEYRHTIAAKTGVMGQQSDMSGVELLLIENFGDYKTVDGLTLPHTYKMKYSTTSNSGTYEYNWGITVSEYIFNQKLADDFFSFDDKK